MPKGKKSGKQTKAETIILLTAIIELLRTLLEIIHDWMSR